MRNCNHLASELRYLVLGSEGAKWSSLLLLLLLLVVYYYSPTRQLSMFITLIIVPEFEVQWRNAKLLSVTKVEQRSVWHQNPFLFSNNWFLYSAQRLVFSKLENSTFRKLILFPSSGELRHSPNLIASSERANINHRMIDKILESGNLDSYIPSSERFRNY
jgi:hypothetical protein